MMEIWNITLDTNDDAVVSKNCYAENVAVTSDSATTGNTN